MVECMENYQYGIYTFKEKICTNVLMDMALVTTDSLLYRYTYTSAFICISPHVLEVGYLVPLKYVEEFIKRAYYVLLAFTRQPKLCHHTDKFIFDSLRQCLEHVHDIRKTSLLEDCQTPTSMQINRSSFCKILEFANLIDTPNFPDMIWFYKPKFASEYIKDITECNGEFFQQATAWAQDTRDQHMNCINKDQLCKHAIQIRKNGVISGGSATTTLYKYQSKTDSTDELRKVKTKNNKITSETGGWCTTS